MRKWTNSIVSPEPHYLNREISAICKLLLHRMTYEDYEKEMRSIQSSRELDKLRTY